MLISFSQSTIFLSPPPPQVVSPTHYFIKGPRSDDCLTLAHSKLVKPAHDVSSS